MDAMDPPQLLFILVRTITGQATGLEVQSTSTIGAVKAMIEEKDGVPAARQRLVFNDTPRDDGVTLGGIGVEDGGAIHLVMGEPDAEPEPEPEPEPKPEAEPAQMEEEALVPNVPETSMEAAVEEP